VGSIDNVTATGDALALWSRTRQLIVRWDVEGNTDVLKRREVGDRVGVIGYGYQGGTKQRDGRRGERRKVLG
jgi:hypothetical protein